MLLGTSELPAADRHDHSRTAAVLKNYLFMTAGSSPCSGWAPPFLSLAADAHRSTPPAAAYLVIFSGATGPVGST